MNPRALEDKIIDSLSFFVWLTFFGGTGIFQCLCVCMFESFCVCVLGGDRRIFLEIQV